MIFDKRRKIVLNVNEVFGPTFQGEGKSAGMPCTFIRLALCNLHCIWCDTPHTWNWIGSQYEHPIKYDRTVEVHQMSLQEIVESVERNGVKAVVVSGGEPLLQHKELLMLCVELKSRGYWIEVETNGTVFPNTQLIDYVDQINCSPKLSSAGDKKKDRIKPVALARLSAISKVNFKFVISSQDDLNEALELIRAFAMKEVRLMPEARTKEELMANSLWVRRLCAQHNFIFSTRLSIIVSGTNRGV